MNNNSCPKCLKSLPMEGLGFCPHCGANLKHNEVAPPEIVTIKISEAKKHADPNKRYKALVVLQQEYPGTLAIERELLYHGRLHEGNKNCVDYSVIKSYLLQPYLTPSDFDATETAKMQEELFNSPQLQKCLALSNNENNFMHEYLLHLSRQFVEIFLLASSYYMRSFLGFTQTSKAPKFLAEPVSAMLNNIHHSETLSQNQKQMLYVALYQGFASAMGSQTSFLDERLILADLPVPAK